MKDSKKSDILLSCLVICAFGGAVLGIWASCAVYALIPPAWWVFPMLMTILLGIAVLSVFLACVLAQFLEGGAK